MGFERVVGPLRLRRPTRVDLDAYVRLHTDARTYAHAPETMPDRIGCGIRLEQDLEDWRDHGFGYLAVEDVATGQVVGWGGVRRSPPHESLNLYYRLSHDRLGRGYGKLLARALTVGATEWLPGETVRASVRVTNPASLRTALAAGLVRIGQDDSRDDPPGTPASDLLELPKVARVGHVDGRLRAQLLDLWVRVNAAGGSVGFLAGATRDDVGPVLDAHTADLASGRSVLGVLREPDGRVVGFGFWMRKALPMYAHLATLGRFQVDPDRRGRNLGGLLLAGLQAIARDLPGVELLRLDYRSGSGLGDFYAKAGWVETGRQPGGLRIAPGDYRDDVAMLRRVDGGPLAGDGRT